MPDLTLTPEKALIFRITHIENVPWILANGLHCCNSPCRDPGFRTIGNPDLIDKRSRRRVLVPPGGTLSDYIPFYFTPHSPMLLNIKTGYNGMTKTPMTDIAVLVTSFTQVSAARVDYLFTDRHAYVEAAQYFRDPGDLQQIDWKSLQARNFRKTPDDPGRCERYQAEALIHGSLPATALLGVGCYGEQQSEGLRREVEGLGLPAKVVVRPGWYF